MMKKVIAAVLITAAAGSQADATVFNGFAVGVNGGVTILKQHNHGGEKVLGTYALQADYDMSKINSFYAGLGLDFALYTGKAGNRHASYKYNWSSEADIRLGYNFCDRTVVYGLVGTKLVNSKATYFGHSKKHTKFAPVIGLGAKTKLAEKISGGLEYRYAFKNAHKIMNHAVLARVSYHF